MVPRSAAPSCVTTLPHLFAGIGLGFADEISTGRIRELPITLLFHQFMGSLAIHILLRPVTVDASERSDAPVSTCRISTRLVIFSPKRSFVALR